MLMTCTDDRLTIALCAGEDRVVPFVITQDGGPFDLTGKRVFLTVRRSPGAPVLLFLVSTSPGEIDITDASGGLLDAVFSSAQVDAIGVGSYRYDLACDNGAGLDRLVIVKNQALNIERTNTQWPA